MHIFITRLQIYREHVTLQVTPLLLSSRSSEVPKDSSKPHAQSEITCADKPRLHAAANGSLTLCAQRLQGLFHSLSKVLFIFRSHYLFAIGLGAIFSLRRSTPAVCTALSNCATLGVLREFPHTRTDVTGRSPSSVTLSVALHLTVWRPFGPCTTIPQLPIPSAADSSIGCSLFTRRYSGNHGCFLVLR